MHEQVIGTGYNNPPVDHSSSLGLVGRRALIRRRKRPSEMASRGRENEWILSFERCTAPETGELMGWTGGDDTLATEVRLTFTSRTEAVAYAERQGLDYSAEPEPECITNVRLVPPWRWNWIPAAPWGEPLCAPSQAPVGSAQASSAQHAPGVPDVERAFVNPAAVFSRPVAVLNHPWLTTSIKWEILRRWAWDEYLKELAASEGMVEGEQSHLEEVKTALLSLGETWRPGPSAPAAAILLLQESMERVAA